MTVEDEVFEASLKRILAAIDRWAAAKLRG